MGGDVLVVDDSPEFVDVLSEYLSARGHSVRTATDGERALSLAAEAPPDLVLLDVVMPGLDGFEVCRRLRERWPTQRMPVLFLSGSENPKDKVRAFHEGGVDYVPKTVRLEEVVARVETHLELQRRTAALEAANRKLEAVEAYRKRFITALVHDIKNPLTPVLKNTEWLLEQPTDDAEVSEVVRDTYVAANYLHRMVLSLLDVARGDESAIDPQCRPVALREWLDETLALARLKLRSTPERLQVRVQDTTAVFDPGLLARVLQNTIDNALKYSPRTEPVHVDVSVRGGGLRLVVEDRGPGVKPEDRERIFAAWVRVSDDAGLARTSHGIGLSFCRQAVEAHGGQMTVEDNAPSGARFIIQLPAQ